VVIVGQLADQLLLPLRAPAPAEHHQLDHDGDHHHQHGREDQRPHQCA
jgi:hypothetical protein